MKSMGLAFSLLALSCAGREEPVVIPEYDAATFYDTITFGGPLSFSADETRILVTSDESGVFNLRALPVSGTGAPEVLTVSDDNAQFAVSYFPGDDRLLFTADEGGNELNHLFVREADGATLDLTPGENLKAMFFGWSESGDSFWVLTNERDPRHFDVYRFESQDYQRELIFRNDAGWSPESISRNGRFLSLLKSITNANNDIYLLDLQGGEEPRLITEHEGDVEHAPMGFTPDHRELYYLTNGHGEFRQAWAYEIESGSHRLVRKADWDVMYVALSETAKYRVSATNEDARTVLEIVDTSTSAPVDLPELPEGDITGVVISRSEQRIAFYVNSDTSPSNVHVLDLATGEHRKLTEALNPAVDREHLVDGGVIRYPSYDGLEIPAVLYRPHDASSENRAPALVWVHGGPGGQSRKGYNAAIQHLVNHGYAILAVNNRGSSGYGKTFHHLDDKKHGDVDLKDCVWARRYLESLDWVDGSRIGIIGGSYGGYMVAAALVFEPDAFDVGIDIFGVTNWVRTLGSIPPWWTAQREALYAELGDPATDEERLRAISPLFHAENIVKPLLVVQGANDPRVLQVESDELVAAAEANGVPVEYVVFPDEGHGFRNRDNRVTASERYVAFLDRHLRGEDSSEPIE
ncbi:MAG TPA: prolyl oligopeptidase family serine peptidase [Vicinamibacteria bacterium]|nr:prolyl oligopeptidase family serine peptidase [Vicinamibacteria bacterium]